MLSAKYPIKTLYYSMGQLSVFRDEAILRNFNKLHEEKNSFTYTSLVPEMVLQEEWYDELSSFLVRTDSAIVHSSNKSIVFGMVNVEKGDIFWLYDADVGVDPDVKKLKSDRDIQEERDAEIKKAFMSSSRASISASIASFVASSSVSLFLDSASDGLMDGEVRG